MTNADRLAPGLEGVARLTVGAADTALGLGSGDVGVLGTPRVVALCEQATVAAVAGRLPTGRTTVGARVEIDHLAPSRVGDSVTARARLVEVGERGVSFSVDVTDDATGRVLARAQVVRVVVDRARFEG